VSCPRNKIKKSCSGLKAFCSRRRPFWGRLLKQRVANDQTGQRTGWTVFLHLKRRKTKAQQCFNRCTCNRVQSTRFVWQEIKGTRPRPWRVSGLRQLLIFYALLQQASNSQNAQWRSQKPFKPCAEFCNLFAGHNTSRRCSLKIR
jgi:hypothetical protein